MKAFSDLIGEDTAKEILPEQGTLIGRNTSYPGNLVRNCHNNQFKKKMLNPPLQKNRNVN